MNKIRVEATQGEGWTDLAEITEGGTPGSISDCTNGADVLLFGWINGQVGVWRSEGWTDYQLGELRGVNSMDMELLSDLREPYERPVIFAGGGLVRVRWSVVS